MSPQDAPSEGTHVRHGPVRRVLLFLFLCMVAFALVEGASSLWLFAEALHAGETGRLAERSHTRYDPMLGWVHVPGLSLPDFYGAGRSLTINAHGFRGRPRVPT